MSEKEIRIQVAPAQWSYREFNNFLHLFQEGRVREAGIVAAKVLKSWDFVSPLEGKNPIGNLSMADGLAVIRAIPQLCSDILDGIDDKDFSVDLSLWTYNDFAEFSERGAAHDIDYVEAEMRRISKINGKPLDAGEIGYIEGAMLMRKIQAEVQKVMSGKN